MNLKVRLALMNFLEFAVWGAYLTSMGRYLGNVGIGENIGLFYSMQGIVSIFMPAWELLLIGGFLHNDCWAIAIC